MQFSLVDVFTKERYAGNPLAVVDTSGSVMLEHEQRCQIAKEFNLSETVFVGDLEAKEDRLVWKIHIHTISNELPFAGHPTIGAACYLVSKHLQGRKPEDGVKASLLVPAGCIDIVYFAQNHTATARVPHDYHQHGSTIGRADLAKLQPELKSPPDCSAIVSIVKGMTFVLIELADLQELGRVQLHTSHPPLNLDQEWATEGHVGVYYYVHLGDNADGTQRIRTRMMDFGVSSEDPATGSAACTLTAFLSLQNAKFTGTKKYMITQGVEMGRTSDIGLEIKIGENSTLEEVTLAGSVANVMKGELVPPAVTT